MLILTRYVGETIVIGADDIRVTVIEVKGRQIKLGIKAPDNMSIHREEVYDRIREENVGQRTREGRHRRSIQGDHRGEEGDS